MVTRDRAGPGGLTDDDRPRDDPEGEPIWDEDMPWCLGLEDGGRLLLSMIREDWFSDCPGGRVMLSRFGGVWSDLGEFIPLGAGGGAWGE